ncbi:MAG: hypothetical protein Q8807_02850, partial ['Waltheria sp.' little leaf phytoplasma]|nr:hypothetical protein ['Waltheria sp.' little leaf phytoplasma]
MGFMSGNGKTKYLPIKNKRPKNFRGVFRYLADGTIQLSFGFKKRLTNPIIDLAEIQKIKNNVKN